MHSCFYEGEVRHRRSSPALHEFRYRLFLSYLDLDEVPELLADWGLFSTRPFTPARFRRGDHFGDPQTPLAEVVRETIFLQSGIRPGGPIRLLTQLCMAGYYFSPLNLFFCFDATGENVESILAEVSNTPWRQRHAYVLWSGNEVSDCSQDAASTSRLRSFRHRKAFHVSPFMPMNFEYHWTLNSPGERLFVHLENHELYRSELDSAVPHPEPFSATLTLQRRPWTRGQKLRLLTQFPLMTAKVVSAIYFEALRLWLKKCPYYPHPDTSRPPASPPPANPQMSAALPHQQQSAALPREMFP